MIATLLIASLAVVLCIIRQAGKERGKQKISNVQSRATRNFFSKREF
jgi:hypothetical protein